MKQEQFIPIAIIVAIIALAGTTSYFMKQRSLPLPAISPVPSPVPTNVYNPAPTVPAPAPIPIPPPKKPKPNPTPTPTPTPTQKIEYIIKKSGERESSFLIQKINPDSVEGLWYQAYPLEIPNDPGSPKILHLGNDIGYACDGASEKLTNINFSKQEVTFTKITGEPPFGGCPICLAGNTLIDTPSGPVRVKDLHIGMPIWTIDTNGVRVPEIVTRTSKVSVPSTHEMVHLILNDGRGLFASPGHPTIDGRGVGDLTAEDIYDGARILSVERIPYGEGTTYDVLPSGETGFYWANGILLGSTLRSFQ